MKGLSCSKVLGAVVLSSLFAAAACHAEGAPTYNCVGMNSSGEKITSTLTLSPTDKADSFTSVWTYTAPNSTPDKGEVSVEVGKGIMHEVVKNDKGEETSQADLYQVSDDQILVGTLNSGKGEKRMGLCSLNK
jgi:hypothetical protein